MDVAAWLRSLGLEQYEEAFRENAIDAELLPRLTAEDLKDLGVTAVGHRRRLLDAAAALCADAASRPPTVRESEGDRTDRAPPAEAERRQLTVMFIDLVGSTALAGRLDPEDMRVVLHDYQDACAGAITRYEGHVAKYMGDGVLAYFGYPRAHEDDPERAVRAGLDATAAVAGRRAPDGTPLAARVGIATGPVIVGDLIGEGAAQEEAVVGRTPNLAARLQALAEAGTVVVSDATRRLLGRLFDLADLGAHDLKGFAEPLRAWRVLGPGRAEGRFAAREAAGLTPLVGREEEVALLLRRWELAKDGEGQVVLLSGEPGIGKSRLVRALRERVAEEPHTPLRYQCSPYHVNSALYPIIEQLERAAGFERDDAADVRLGKMERLLGQGGGDIAAAPPLVADLLSIPTEGRYPPLDLTPQRRKENLFEALLGQLEGLAAKRPVLEVFEDVHWLDPTTAELLARVVDRVRDLPMLLVITFRPEFTPPWTGHAHVTLLTLSRLGRREGTAMVARVAGGKTVPQEVVEQIVAKTDGVPLFVEELTKTVLGSGLLREESDRYVLSGPLPPLAIPATLQDSLMARLDRLAPVKEVAQIGAVIGREFAHELLAAVAPLPESRLQEALDQLIEAELVFRRGTPPEATYAFKHALVQETAYASLLKSRRQQLHARIARVLEERLPEAAEARPELLAHHCTEAGMLDKAIGYWQRAGERAVRRAANLEAIQHFRKALDLLGSQPDGRERAAAELRLLTQLGPAAMAVHGWAAREVERVYHRAREISRRLEPSAELAPALVGQWLFYHSRAEFASAREVTAEMLALARRLDDPELLLQAHHAAWPTPMYLGEFDEAHDHIAQGLALYDEDKHRHHAFLYLGHDPAVCGRALGATVLWTLGYPDRADQYVDAAIGHARRLAHAPTLAFGLWFCCQLLVARGDSSRAAPMADELLAVASEYRLALPWACAAQFKGWSLARQGEVAEGLRKLYSGIEAWRKSGARFALPHRLLLLAETHASGGDRPLALATLAQALQMVETTGERWFESDMHRSMGQLMLAGPNPDRSAVVACFRAAIDVARRQNARMWELRAATSLARLWAEDGEHQRAHDLLAPVYGWFTEGFDTPDLQEAKRLLDGLR